MRTITQIMVASSLVLAVLGIVVYLSSVEYPRIRTYVGDYFIIPSDCKNLGLLGCTPHPVRYLEQCDNPYAQLKAIQLNHFLDKAYVYDSFERTFTLCKMEEIDHLLIAYLPIYYIGMHQLLGSTFMAGCRLFLTRIIQEIMMLIKEAADTVGYEGGITVILPPDYQLARVPYELHDVQERIRYLIKQFPVLSNITHSPLQTITIINNKESAQDDALIDYLKYEYLYEKPVIFRKSHIDKGRFHA